MENGRLGVTGRYVTSPVETVRRYAKDHVQIQLQKMVALTVQAVEFRQTHVPWMYVQVLAELFK